MHPIISIIIPVYNRENYISRLLKSLIPQLSNELEVIIVDDGSTDKTLQVCKNFAREVPCIRVIQKQNGGVSSARNFGLDQAKGLYISFVDSDDELELDAYQKLINIVKSYQPDIVDFGSRYIGFDGICGGEVVNTIEKNCLLNRAYILEYIIPPTINLVVDNGKRVLPFLWTKLFKTEIIKNNNIRFDESRKTWEDLPFIVNCLKYANSFYSISEYLYRYIGTPNSLSTKYTTDYFKIIIENFALYKSLFEKEYNFETQYVYDYWSNAFHNMIFCALKQDSNFDENRSIIDKALLSDEVQQWVQNSSKDTRFLKNISKVILNKNLEVTYYLYKKEYKKRSRIGFIQKIKGLLRKIKKGILKNG